MKPAMDKERWNGRVTRNTKSYSPAQSLRVICNWRTGELRPLSMVGVKAMAPRLPYLLFTIEHS